MLKAYYYLTKPGIVYSNTLAAAGGFLLAAQGHIAIPAFLATLAGTALIIASACVCNNVMDSSIDKKMARTKRRAVPTGKISPVAALTYAAVLGFIGAALLAYYSGTVTFIAGMVAFVFYVVFYGIAKRRSVYGTLVGSIPGAIPPLAGYAAVTHSLDAGALLLFAILVCWQMPHFYAIAMFRADDYRAAGIPVLPVVRGFRETKLHILAYICAFIIAVALLAILGYAGYTFLVIMVALGLTWLWFGVQGFRAENVAWARKMFGFSLVVLMSFCILISIDSFLP